ncbi:uncharacterized protein [Nicotiana tomentosiformis]|uniref:uncharacterized protein n=1 Tax=Nicotiana tomentosiformis TaxID=4098 RepID=UPI00388CAEC0
MEYRSWMYNRNYPNCQFLTEEFIEAVNEFIKHAMSLEPFQFGGMIRCPCVKCSHGEVDGSDGVFHNIVVGESSRSVGNNVQHPRYYKMVVDVFGMHFEFESHESVEQTPKEEAKYFYEQLEAASHPLCEGSMHSQLSVAVRLLSIKSYTNIFQAEMDSFIGLMSELVNPNFNIPDDFYKANRLVSKLGLSSMRIDCCEDGCMLYYKGDADLESCKLCKKNLVVSGFPAGRRLYASILSVPHMRWHYENRRLSGVICHPLDGEAWKHFDTTYPDFASEPRNVRLGSCAYGFTSLSLWYDGVETYDISTKQNFNLRANLMWTINNLSAYGMLSGRMTAGKLACPYCMDNDKAFTLRHGRKQSWFDCHRQLLPVDREFRRMKNALKKNTVEHDLPPPILSGEKIWERVQNFTNITEAPPSRFSSVH